jgi:hypothetical protein
MRVIITGGTGFIGCALAVDLAAVGNEVVVLSRNPGKAPGLPVGVRAERWDGRTAAGWGQLADGALAIVNLAGENLAGGGFLPARWTPERKQLIRQSRLDAGHAVVEAVQAARVKPQVVIQSSGIGYYGTRGDRVRTETDGPGADFLARLTVDWEASTAPVALLGVRHVSIRSGVVLSPTEGALYRLLLPFKLFAGGPMGSGRQGVFVDSPGRRDGGHPLSDREFQSQRRVQPVCAGTADQQGVCQSDRRGAGPALVAAGAGVCLEAGAG